VSLGWGGKTSDILGIPSLSPFPKIESLYGHWTTSLHASLRYPPILIQSLNEWSS
jgi:hypothetical protein